MGASQLTGCRSLELFEEHPPLPGAARARGCALLPAPAAERRGAGGAVAPGRARAPRGRAGLPGWRVTSSICNPHGRTTRWPDGAGAGSQGGVQWPGTLSTMAVASRARELLGLALLSAAAVRGRGKGCGCHTRQRARLFVADIRASHVLARSRENETSYILVGRRRTLGPPGVGGGVPDSLYSDTNKLHYWYSSRAPRLL